MYRVETLLAEIAGIIYDFANLNRHGQVTRGHQCAPPELRVSARQWSLIQSENPMLFSVHM